MLRSIEPFLTPISFDRYAAACSRVWRWRGGLGLAYLFPALSFAGASLARPCSVSTLPLIKPDVRISRILCCRQHKMRYVAPTVMWR
jgi:hypothetical protein